MHHKNQNGYLLLAKIKYFHKLFMRLNTLVH